MQKIMIIRHAEKPVQGGPDRSVCIDGFHAKHELTVRGWQRAAALVPFFAPAHARPESHPIAPPRAIFASAVTFESPSLRAQRTVEPLALALGIAVDRTHAEFEEEQLAAAALQAPSPVLIAWHHHRIPALARLIAGDALPCPAEWPDHRYDVVWVLIRDQPTDAWRYLPVAQRLFAHDPAEAF